jgi:tetratricopeptide (TPR) repeat protein
VSGTPHSLVGVHLAGRYRVDHLLGAGGMGVVYAATDLERGKPCAIKLLHSETNDEATLARFKREFRAAARLNHPNCLQVFALDHAEVGWFFSMEHVTGGSLQWDPPPCCEKAVAIGLQILAALDHIHSKQIVHRDLKPQNILLQPSAPTGSLPIVKVTDFGIAGFGHLRDVHGIGLVEGSLPFISPEQALGEPVDPRSDLYSLGVVLYLLLSGRHPLRLPPGAPPTAWIDLHHKTEPEPLHSIKADIPEAVSAVVMRLLRKVPRERYTTAADAYDELVDWLGAEHPDLLPAQTELARRGYLASPRVIGRDRELARARSYLEGAFESLPTAAPVLFIRGSGGSGKSRLTGQLLQRAAELDSYIFVATCRQQPGAPFEPLIPFLNKLLGGAEAAPSPSLNEAPPEESTQEVRPHAGLDVARTDEATIIANHGDLSGRREEPRNSGLPMLAALGLEGGSLSEGEQWRYFRATADALLRVSAKRRVTLVLEDMQWADAGTVDLLVFWIHAIVNARRWQTCTRLAIVVTHRPEAEKFRLDDLYEVAEAGSNGTIVELGPLSAQAATELVSDSLMVPIDADVTRFTQALLQDEEAYPLHLSQLLQAMLSSGQLVWNRGGWDLSAAIDASIARPRSIREAIGEQAMRLSVETQQVLAAAAVIGVQFDLDALRAVMRADEWLVLDCLDEAIRNRFVAEEDCATGVFRFQNQAYRESVYARLPEGSRTHLHRQTAAHLCQRLGSNPELASEVSHHFEGCQEWKEAYGFARAAADYASQQLSFSLAADFYRRAATLASRGGIEPAVDLSEREGDACLQGGDYERANGCFELRLTALTEPELRAEVLRKMATVHYRRGDTAGSLLRFKEVLRTLGFRLPHTRVGYVLGMFGNGLLMLIYHLAGGRFAARQLSPEKRRRLRIGIRVALQTTEVLYFSDYIALFYFMLRSLVLAERLGPSIELADACVRNGMALTGLGLPRAARGWLLRAWRYYRQERSVLDTAWATFLRALVAGYRGEWALESSLMLRAEKTFQRAHDAMRLRQIWTLRGEALLAAGQPDEVAQMATQLRTLAEDLADHRGLGWGHYLLGHVAARRGELEVASYELTLGYEHATKGTDPNTQSLAQSRLALALGLAGRLDEAVPLAEEAAVRQRRYLISHQVNAAIPIFVAVAALKLRRDGKLARSTSWRVRRLCAFWALFMPKVGYVEPAWHVAVGAWLVARGSQRRGRARIQRGLRLAEQRGLAGELSDLRRVAALVGCGALPREGA